MIVAQALLLDKTFFGVLSLALVALSGIPYIVSVLRGVSRPHVFTWILWALLSAIAAGAQYSAHAGPGYWATAFAALFSLATAFLALSHGHKEITRSDWIAFGCGLSALPIWYVTKNAFVAAALATAIDAAGYIPTIRKSFLYPKDEMIFSYVISNAKHFVSMLAIATYSATTLIYPTVIFVMNLLLITVLVTRRQYIGSTQKTRPLR